MLSTEQNIITIISHAFCFPFLTDSAENSYHLYMQQIIRVLFPLFVSIFAYASFLFIPQAAFAQEVVTPTLYCLGACPTSLPSGVGTTTVPTEGTGGTIPATTTQPTSGTQTSPTVAPCETATASVARWGKKHHKRHHGWIGRFMQWLLELISKLMEQLGISNPGGGTTPTPEPDPCGTPTEVPSEAPEPTEPLTTTAPTAVTTPGTTVVPTTGVTGTTPVAINGQLKVCGTKLCNQFNKPIQLRGMSTHGLQWHGACYNDSSIAALANDWKADIIRVAMYVQEQGYETDPTGFTTKADAIIDAAIANGMYVLIDWHILTPGDPAVNLVGAKTYFTHMATKYGSKPNVMYEIANEPNGVTWPAVKTYSEEIIPVIRAIDPDAVIVVGTTGFSSLGLAAQSNPQETISNPVNAQNIMYTFHFYAASHGDSWRQQVSTAADSLPIFATEWGTQTYSGDGANDLASSQAWLDLFKEKGISWTNWNYADDFRSGSVFNEGTCPNGPWNGSNLKEAGTWVRNQLIQPDNFPTN